MKISTAITIFLTSILTLVCPSVYGHDSTDFEPPVFRAEPEAERYQIPDRLPEFEGGSPIKFTNWIYSKIASPVAVEARFNGSNVKVEFTVTREGRLRDATIAESDNEKLAAEVLRLASQSPAWKPAMKDGRAVDHRITASILYNKPEAGLLSLGIGYEPAVDMAPMFDGNPDRKAFGKYIEIKTAYPIKLSHSEMNGLSAFTFVIDTNGEVKDLKITDSPHPAVDKKIKKAMKKCPKWIPASENGRPTEVTVTVRQMYNLLN